ncbi:MAG: hypothetical protein WC250_00380 [Candidatus Paceibacterota bacterium]|jgi:hypothetical protein
MRKSLQWQALEYPVKTRTSDWYVATVIIIASLVVSAIIFGNALFAVLIVIAAATLFMHTRRPPKLITFEINQEGILSGEIFYPFGNLLAFGIDGDESGPKLILKAQSGFLPIITLPLGEVDIIVVKDYLNDYIKEEPLRVPFSEQVMGFLGF